MIPLPILLLVALVVIYFGFRQLGRMISLKITSWISGAWAILFFVYLIGTVFFDFRNLLGISELLANVGLDVFMLMPLAGLFGTDSGRSIRRRLNRIEANLLTWQNQLEVDKASTISDISLAETYLSLGNAQYEAGQTDNALASFTEAVRLAEAVHVNEHPALLRFYNSMLRAVKNKKDKSAEAELDAKIAGANTNTVAPKD